MTLLYVAAQRGDIQMAQLALLANPDLTLRDVTFHATPLGWQNIFSR
jgi:hypothetical protein